MLRSKRGGRVNGARWKWTHISPDRSRPRRSVIDAGAAPIVRPREGGDPGPRKTWPVASVETPVQSHRACRVADRASSIKPGTLICILSHSITGPEYSSKFLLLTCVFNWMNFIFVTHILEQPSFRSTFFCPLGRATFTVKCDGLRGRDHSSFSHLARAECKTIVDSKPRPQDIAAVPPAE